MPLEREMPPEEEALCLPGEAFGSGAIRSARRQVTKAAEAQRQDTAFPRRRFHAAVCVHNFHRPLAAGEIIWTAGGPAAFAPSGPSRFSKVRRQQTMPQNTGKNRDPAKTDIEFLPE